MFYQRASSLFPWLTQFHSWLFSSCRFLSPKAASLLLPISSSIGTVACLRFGCGLLVLVQGAAAKCCCQSLVCSFEVGCCRVLLRLRFGACLLQGAAARCCCKVALSECCVHFGAGLLLGTAARCCFQSAAARCCCQSAACALERGVVSGTFEGCFRVCCRVLLEILFLVLLRWLAYRLCRGSLSCQVQKGLGTRWYAFKPRLGLVLASFWLRFFVLIMLWLRWFWEQRKLHMQHKTQKQHKHLLLRSLCSLCRFCSCW